MFSATTLISTCKPAVPCITTSSTYCENNGFEILKQQLLTHIEKTKHKSDAPDMANNSNADITSDTETRICIL
jgi:hypothetical protein